MSEWKVLQLSQEEWAEKFSENIHKVVFKEIKPGYRDRISYAVLVVKDEEVIGYVTVREIDNEAVYWQFGGIVPKYQKTMTAVKCIETALKWQKERSLRIVTYVKNTNLPMLRFYLGYGFLIIGTRTYRNDVMVDMVKELHGN